MRRRILIFSFILFVLGPARAGFAQGEDVVTSEALARELIAADESSSETISSDVMTRDASEDLKRLEILQRLRARDPGFERESKPKWIEKPLPKPMDFKEPIAYVNGDVLSYAEVFEQFQQKMKENPDSGSQIADEDWNKFKNKEMISYVLNWIQNALLYHYAKSQGLEIKPAEIQQQIQLLTELSMMQESLDEVLQERGVTREQLEAELERTMLIGKLLVAGVKQKYSEPELRQYYKNFLSELKQPESVYVVTLFVSFYADDESRLPDAEIAKLRERMEDFRNQAATPRDFIALARKNSGKPYDGNRCLLGWVSRGSTDLVEKAVKAQSSPDETDALKQRIRDLQELRDFYFQQKMGQISPVFESFAGLHLAMVLEHRDAVGDTFESVRGTIELAFADAYKTELTKELRKNASIFIDFNGLAPQTIQALRKRGQNTNNK